MYSGLPVWTGNWIFMRNKTGESDMEGEPFDEPYIG